MPTPEIWLIVCVCVIRNYRKWTTNKSHFFTIVWTVCKIHRCISPKMSDSIPFYAPILLQMKKMWSEAQNKHRIEMFKSMNESANVLCSTSDGWINKRFICLFIFNVLPSGLAAGICVSIIISTRWIRSVDSFFLLTIKSAAATKCKTELYKRSKIAKRKSQKQIYSRDYGWAEQRNSVFRFKMRISVCANSFDNWFRGIVAMTRFTRLNTLKRDHFPILSFFLYLFEHRDGHRTEAKRTASNALAPTNQKSNCVTDLMTATKPFAGGTFFCFACVFNFFVYFLFVKRCDATIIRQLTEWKWMLAGESVSKAHFTVSSPSKSV